MELNKSKALGNQDIVFATYYPPYNKEDVPKLKTISILSREVCEDVYVPAKEVILSPSAAKELRDFLINIIE